MAASRTKVWRASRNSAAGITVRDNVVQIIGSPRSALEVNKDSIGLVSNSLAFGLSSSRIRTGGMFAMKDEFESMIPSTIVTATPQRSPDPPFGFIMGLVPMVPLFAMLFAGIAGG